MVERRGKEGKGWIGGCGGEDSERKQRQACMRGRSSSQEEEKGLPGTGRQNVPGAFIEKAQRPEQEKQLNTQVQMDFGILLAERAANKIQNRPP